MCGKDGLLVINEMARQINSDEPWGLLNGVFFFSSCLQASAGLEGEEHQFPLMRLIESSFTHFKFSLA